MLVYRDNELDNLNKAYYIMYETNTIQLRFLAGEAGTGKTALANMFLDNIAQDDNEKLIVSSFCTISSDYDIPYQPFKELLRNLLTAVQENEQLKITKKDKTKKTLAFFGKLFLENGPDLLGNFIPGANLFSGIGTELSKKFFNEEDEKSVIEESKILEQYVAVLRAIATKYKLVLFIDDIQWIDKSSVNLFHHLLVGLKNSPVMFLSNYRSVDININEFGEKHPLSRLLTEIKIDFGNVIIDLDHISEDEKRAFVNNILDCEENLYDDEFREKIFEHTNGNPLFVNELLNLFKAESTIKKDTNGVLINNEDFHWDSYPIRIEGIIQERISRLDDSSIKILSQASVQGQTFIAQVLAELSGISDRELLLTLSEKLQKQHRLVNERKSERVKNTFISNYIFSNYVFQKYFYQELSIAEKMLLHGDVARILENLFTNNIDSVSADIAKHYELSNEYDKAIPFIKITIQNFMHISAYNESSVLIKKALELISDLDNKELQEENLYFHAQLCVCYSSLKGWGNPEVEKIYCKTQKIAENLSIHDYDDILLFGIWSINLAKLNLNKSLNLSNNHLKIAKEKDNEEMILNSFISKGNTLFWMGKLKESEKCFNSFLELYNTKERCDPPNDMGFIYAKMFLLLINQQFNIDQNNDYNDQMNIIEDDIIQNLSKSKNPFYKVVAYQALSWFAFLDDDENILNDYSKKLVKTAEEYNFKFYQGVSKLFYVEAEDMDIQERIDIIKRGYDILLENCNSKKSIMHSIYGLSICQVFLNNNLHDEFIKTVDKIINTAIENDEKCYLNRLYNLKMEYYIKIKDSNNAKKYLNKTKEAFEDLVK